MEAKIAIPTYSQIVKYRDDFPSYWRFPVKKVPCGEDFAARFVVERGWTKVLDVGSHTRGFLKDYLTKYGFRGQYVGVDNDPAVEPDYYDLLDIPDQHLRFDAIVMLNTIEHVPSSVFLKWVAKAADLLVAGGGVIILTPNTLYPDIHCDFTHIQFYPLIDLLCVLKAFGFSEIHGFRMWHFIHRESMAKKRFWRAIQELRVPFNRLLGMDLNCMNILVVGIK